MVNRPVLFNNIYITETEMRFAFPFFIPFEVTHQLSLKPRRAFDQRNSLKTSINILIFHPRKAHR